MPRIKIGPVRVLSAIYKTFHKNSTVDMYYVNIKIWKKKYHWLSKKNCDLLALFISSKSVWEVGEVVVHQLRAENLGLWLTRGEQPKHVTY